jgi:hypothetical protein
MAVLSVSGQVSGQQTETSEARATYSNCRQFQVIVEETLQLPKP